MFQMLKNAYNYAKDAVKRFGRSVQRKAAYVLSSLGFGFMFITGNALAALPASVTTDLATAKSDIVEVGAIVIGLAVAVAAIFWVKKPIR